MGQDDQLVCIAYAFKWIKKKYISYKLGTYLAAGLPVIIPRGISNEELISKNNLGFAVDSITEALEKLERLTQEEYLQYKNAVKEFAPLLQQGYFTKQALVQAVFDTDLGRSLYFAWSAEFVCPVFRR